MDQNRFSARGIGRVVTSLFTVWIALCAARVAAAGGQDDQEQDRRTPCGITVDGAHAQGLAPVADGAIVYDSKQGLCWLADANLAGNPDVRAVMNLSTVNADGSTPVINPDGTMDYETALNWVDALNSFDNGNGWLHQNDWQLPTTPVNDPTCSSQNGGNFGVLCTRSALGHLYNVGLARTYPDTVVPIFNFVSPFLNLQPALYWTSDVDANGGGEVTFSFNTRLEGSNTTKYNYFHVLPMTKAVLGQVPSTTGVVPYVSGPAAGRAVYDNSTGLSWTLDANLAAQNNFGVTGTITIPSDINGSELTVPLVDADGAVHFSAIDPAGSTGWLVSMNQSEYAGTHHWKLPAVADLQQLYDDIGLQAGDVRLEWLGFVGPFSRLQPGFYWTCERDQPGDRRAACGPNHPGFAPGPNMTPMEWSFNFDDGFQGTDKNDKQFYVMVYFRAPSAR